MSAHGKTSLVVDIAALLRDLRTCHDTRLNRASRIAKPASCVPVAGKNQIEEAISGANLVSFLICPTANRKKGLHKNDLDGPMATSLNELDAQIGHGA